MEEQKQKTEEELSKPVTLGILFEFAEEVFLPSFSKLFDEKFELKLHKAFEKRHKDLKDYFGRKLDESTTELFACLNKSLKARVY